LVGNGVTSEIFDGDAYVPFIHDHALIDNDLYDAVFTTCKGVYYNATGACLALLDQVDKQVEDLNVYNIYENCYGLTQKSSKVSPLVSRPLHDVFYRIQTKVRETVGEQVPCIDTTRAYNWLNQQSVRTATHTLPTTQWTWEICTDAIDYTRVYATMIPIYQQLLAAGYRVLVYSGDTDLCVPFTGSEAWTRSLKLPIQANWRPWNVDKQVAGYVKVYSGGLTYATIKGAGHTVPEYKPPQALHFFDRFLSNQPF